MTKFQKLLVKGRKYTRCGNRIMSKMLKRFMRIYYQCDISFEADISDNVYFCHGGFGTVINPKAIIGSDTIIQHRVTIGELSPGGGAPIIGKNVFIGAGAIVLHDVGLNDTVVGVPAHSVIKKL